MKQLFGLLLVALFLIAGIIGFAEETTAGIWKLAYYVDEFKLPTDETYVRNIEPIAGTFCNSAVTDAELNVVILIDEYDLAFMLYEYGNSMVKNSYSSNKVVYDVTMLNSAHQKIYMSGYMLAAGDRILFDDDDAKIIIQGLMTNNTLSFYIAERENPNTNYLFTIPDTKGVVEILTALNNTFHERDYQQAVALYNSGIYHDALSIFTTLGSYKDSADWQTKYESMMYEKAETLLIEKNYAKANAAFIEANGYSDAADRVGEPYYIQAEVLLAEKDYDGAIEAFRNAGAYKDAEVRIPVVYYTKGEELFAVKDYDKASEAFKQAGAYSDAIAMATESLYQKGMTLMSEEDYDAAYSLFVNIEGYKDVDNLLENNIKLIEAAFNETLPWPAEMSDFTDGIARVRMGDKWGGIDTKGNLIVPFEYNHIGSFSEGFAYVEKNIKYMKNGLYGFIDTTGKLIVPCKYDNAYAFSEGFAWVKDGLEWGVIDTAGNLVIPCEYDYVDSFSEGLAAVEETIWREKNGYRYNIKSHGFIDTTGKRVLTYECYDAYSFSEGLAQVRKDIKDECLYGFINKTGKLVISYKYDYASAFSEGLSAVKYNGKYGFINTKGKNVIPCEYDNAYSFTEGLARVKKDDKWGFIDKTGKLVIPCEYDNAYSFNEGFAPVEKDNKWGCIDNTGNIIVPLTSYFAPCYYDGFFYFREHKNKRITILARDEVQPEWREETERQKLLKEDTDENTIKHTQNALKQGDSNNDVLNMKKRLQELGYFSADASLGKQFSATTSERVKLFQKANGLEETGKMDSVALELLYSDEAKENPER